MGLINGSLIDSGLSDLAWIEKYQKLEQQLFKLQQEKEDLIKWLDIKIKHISWFDNSGYTRGEYNTLKDILEKLGE